MKKLIIILLLLFCFVPQSFAGTYMFSDKPSHIKRWLAVKGYGGSTYDALMAYFSSLSGLSEGTLYDHVNATLINLGYTGSMNDMLNAFFTTTTGQSGNDGERAFWGNDSYSFGGVSLDNALLYNGDYLIYNGDYLIYTI